MRPYIRTSNNQQSINPHLILFIMLFQDVEMQHGSGFLTTFARVPCQSGHLASNVSNHPDLAFQPLKHLEKDMNKKVS
jgi:hypothetical protein